MRLNVFFFSLIVTEADTRPGGVIRSSSTAEGFLWEEGPNSFQPTPALLKAAVCPFETFCWCIFSCCHCDTHDYQVDSDPAYAAFCVRILHLRTLHCSVTCSHHRPERHSAAWQTLQGKLIA